MEIIPQYTFGWPRYGPGQAPSTCMLPYWGGVEQKGIDGFEYHTAEFTWSHWKPVEQLMQSTASFSSKASMNRSAVSSSEVGGFVFSLRNKDDRFRHSFFGSPLLSEIFLPQNKLCLLANSCCFFLACMIQACRSVLDLDFRKRCSRAWFLCIFISVKATFYKNGLIINLVILFVFFCAFESIDLSFSTDRFFVLICMLF